MTNRLIARAAVFACVAAGLTAVPAPAIATVGAAAPPPVVTLSVSGGETQVSATTIRPGIVEFQVGKTFMIPGPDRHPDFLSVVATDQLPVIAAALPALFGDGEDPAAAAAAATAVRAVRAAGTFYGGGGPGTTWRVNLTPGTYTVVGVESLAMGLGTVATFTVAGERRAGALPFTDAAVRAIGPVGANKWTFRQPKAPVEWLRFSNSSKELHFLDMNGVKAGTTSADVKKAFSSPREPKFFTNTNVHFDVISPGVSVAIRGPVDPGSYLITCFMPSEADGMPHALMGMWKLVSVK